jgi:hypothetical protein
MRFGLRQSAAKRRDYDSRSETDVRDHPHHSSDDQYGGYFLLTSLLNKSSGYMENPLRQNFFRAGHAHAGVIVILSLVCQILADGAVLPTPLLWFVRIGVPLAAILISAGFFFSVLPPTATQASGAVSLIYAGAVILALGVVTLGIGLLRTAPSS